MPAVHIEYRHGILTQEAKTVLKEVIRTDLSFRFSTTRLTLGLKDFGIKLDELSEDSEPTNDIVVRVQLHAYRERLAADIDQEARFIARNLVVALSELDIDKTMDIGVSLLFAEIGWGTASVARNYVEEGDR